MKQQKLKAFTLVELLIASSLFAGVTVGLLTFGQTSVRMVARNLATNHSHDVVRISELRMLDDLHSAASPFRLVSFDGTTYSDVTTSVTTDQEPLTSQYVSTRANGVRFRQYAGGPYKLKTSTTPSSTNLTFDFGVGGKLPYIPQVGDKVVLPLISREYALTAVPTIPTLGSTQGTVTVNAPGGIGFTIDATTSGNVTTGAFYREIAYTAYGGQLRFHPNFTGTSRSTFRIVHWFGVTSPKPFGLLYPTSASLVGNLALRVSLETYDKDYTARPVTNGTTTLQTIIPPLNTPVPISATDSY